MVRVMINGLIFFGVRECYFYFGVSSVLVFWRLLWIIFFLRWVYFCF